MSSTKDTQDTVQQTPSSRRKGMSSSKHAPRRQFTNSRRERPRKLRVFRDELPRSEDLYQPDISSFVSACAPGIYVGKNDDGNNTTDRDLLSPRASSIHHKRSLPSLSFLATTTIAAEKKKMKIEEEKRQEAIAELEARKVLALNPLHSIVDVGETKKEDMSSSINNLSSEIESTKEIKNTTASNVLMPPLLKQFLHLRSKGIEEREGDN